jgi:hypothetical protein
MEWSLAISAERDVIHHQDSRHAWPLSAIVVSPACAVSEAKRTTWSPSAIGEAA